MRKGAQGHPIKKGALLNAKNIITFSNQFMYYYYYYFYTIILNRKYFKIDTFIEISLILKIFQILILNFIFRHSFCISFCVSFVEFFLI